MYQLIKGKKAAQLSIMLVILLSYYLAHGQNSQDYSNQRSQAGTQQPESWRLYPFTLQINPHGGLLMPLPLLTIPDKKVEPKMLTAWGAGLDFSLLYDKRSIFQHFDCYPRLGLNFNYLKLRNEGNIYEGLFYVEPNYNHSTGWEILPRFGVGAAYIRIPGHHPTSEEVTDVDNFREEIGLDLAFSWGVRYRLTPQWHLYGALGFNHLPSFEDTTNTQGIDKSLTMYHLHLGSSYTFNPSRRDYVRPEGPKKSRIDVGLLHSWTKLDNSAFNNLVASKVPNAPIDVNDPEQLYYIIGLHAQGSLQIANSHAIIVGTECIQNAAAEKDSAKKLKKSGLQIGTHIGHEYLWGRVTFGQALGYYLVNYTIFPPPFGMAYSQLTLNYHITELWFIGTGLKIAIWPELTKWVKYDYLDIRIGCSF